MTFRIALLIGALAFCGAGSQAAAAAQAASAAQAPARAHRSPLPENASPARAATLPSYKELKFPPLKPIKIPDTTTFSLPNGLRVYLLEHHELPLVSGLALVRTGNLFDPPDKVGLAGMTGSVMRTGGTRDKTGDQLDEQLENIAASVESSIGETSGQVSFSALRENTDEVLGVFHDVLTRPEFRQDKINLAKIRARSAISRRNDNPEGIAGREFTSIVYGRETPYGWIEQYENIDRIERGDLVAFYRRYFFPANIMLAVYGDFSAPEMRAKIEKLFGSWDYKQPPGPAFPAVRNQAEPGVFVGVKEDTQQTFFHAGHLGGTLEDKNTPALEIMADILGGSFTSRLFRRVRTQLGWAYGVGASWGAAYDHPGIFEISGSTKSATTTETLRVIREEVGKIRTAPVTQRELEIAKNTVLNSFIFAFDTPAKTLSRLVRYEYYGYPRDFIFQYQEAIAAVTRADVLRVAKEYLRPEDFTIVAVGNPQKFGKPLTALGEPVKQLDLTIPQPKTSSAETQSSQR